MGTTLKGFVKKVVKDQKKRISNVGATLKAAVTGRVQSNTGNKVIDKVLSTVASNPFKTALVGGTIANIPKAISVFKGGGTGILAKANKVTKVSKNKGATGSTARPGMSDVNTASVSSDSNAPGMVKPPEATGGLATKVQETSTSRASSAPRKKRRSSTSPRKKRRSSSSRKKRSRKKRYGTAKQYARKGGKSVRYTKNGQPYIILSDGRARFVKGKRR